MKQIAPLEKNDAVKAYDEKTVETAMAVIIAKLFQMAGQKSIASDIVVYAKAMTSELRNNYRSYSLEEVNFAMERGVLGDYGEYIGINLVSMSRWMKAYSKSEQRAARFKATTEQKAIPERNELSDEQKHEISRQGVIRKFNAFKERGECLDPGNSAYFFLERLGLIALSNDEKQVIFERAKVNVLAASQQQKLSTHKATAMSAAELIQAIIGGKKTGRGIIQAEARRIALEDYFRSVIKNGGNIENEIMPQIKPEPP